MSVLPLQARDLATLTAIELYKGPSGIAYVQITDVLINGKDELRSCGSEPTIGKSSYGKLEKVSLVSGDTLEYRNDGTLALTKAGQTSCVLPANLKFEKNTSPTPAALAERAVLQGRIITPAAGESADPPPLMPGVKLVFVVQADVELAEYLRAERASDIAGWQAYVKGYASSPHTVAAKQALSALLTNDGNASFAAYRKTAQTSPAYADLRDAKIKSDQALALVPGDPAANLLKAQILKEIAALAATPQGELDVYRKALGAHTPGYSHLLNARKLADLAVTVDPGSAVLVNLQEDVNTAVGKIQSSMQSAESLMASQQLDQAFAEISDYVALADEEPRLAAIVNATYQFHFSRGQELVAAEDWQGAQAEFQHAGQIRNTDEVAAALHKTAAGLESARNRSAALEAIKQSQALTDQQQYIQAYELLAALPDAQRALAKDEIEKLVPLYVPTAVETAKGLQQAHNPIHGLADEIGIQKAHEYVQRAYKLSADASLTDEMAALGEELSEYYLSEAKRYMSKPLASGVGLGWLYLDKALPYKASNLDAVRDEMTKAASSYQIRSKLSIRVVFRDQTSRRDSGGFAEQLADAIATGLESGGLLVKVIRPTDTTSLEPNFQLIGDVLEHRRTVVPTVEPKESKYRAGQHEIPSEEWSKANRDYEAVLLELQSAQRSAEGAQAHGKKKEIADADERVVQVQKKVEEAHSKLDSITRTFSVDIIQPYTYTRRNIDLGAIVQLQFRIADFSGAQAVGTVPILREAHQTFTLLENVKPEDTEGVKAQGTIPDEIQFLTEVEVEARDKLIKAVCEKVAELPAKVLEQARKKVAVGDLEGAAESYILYLNSTSTEPSSERQDAGTFLREQFNIRIPFNASY